MHARVILDRVREYDDSALTYLYESALRDCLRWTGYNLPLLDHDSLGAYVRLVDTASRDSPEELDKDSDTDEPLETRAVSRADKGVQVRPEDFIDDAQDTFVEGETTPAGEGGGGCVRPGLRSRPHTPPR